MFNDDGTVQGNIENGTYSGKWQANAKDRSIRITQIECTVSLSGKNKEFIDKLKKRSILSRRQYHVAPCTQ